MKKCLLSTGVALLARHMWSRRGPVCEAGLPESEVDTKEIRAENLRA